ncbi:sugar ABC transporter ATP-binding protein [Rhabdobacter roseus]|uniref:Ribose transport system ATP-binding protein n=1 Tax=Rhabdobacter roseus TaxID=1655419 RepID=A0A840TJV4_9BACT|nr:sugar ABC transporter ATP-binding protein [Rhabdobacter roseus]MBB5283704.1 ribose transport system ATP-binding protein [Rhabdobacter roseus]
MFLEIQRVTKNFGDVSVLKDINLALKKGTILGLVGENGAGKSTLMNILGGIHQPSSGKIIFEDKSFTPTSPSDSLRAGISLVHQELNLFYNLSINENLHITGFPHKKVGGLSILDQKTARIKTERLLSAVGLDIDPTAIVGDLSSAQKQLVEIAKALSTSPRLIIFDEPKTSLTKYEADNLFRLIQELKSQQTTIIYISHNLDDVIQLGDQISVLRDGVLVNTYNREDKIGTSQLINDMIGRELNHFYPIRNTKPEEETIFQTNGIYAKGLLNDITFELKKKEVLGLYGLVGAGRSEMVRALYGLDALDGGSISWKNEEVLHPTPANWVRKKVALLTEDRGEDGLLPDDTMEKNIALASLPTYSKNPGSIVNWRELKKNILKTVQATKIKYHSLTDQSVKLLSGGNQQKVILSKWLLTEPELLIIDEPTRGIDIGAKYDIYDLINKLVENGMSVLMVSSEIEELIGMCDRILVMKQGTISNEFKKQDFNRSAILEAALHTSE